MTPQNAGHLPKAQIKHSGLLRNFIAFGSWTLGSRVLGFVREALILGFLGTGPLYQAYVVAMRLPNMFRQVFSEGGLSNAFVPLFSRKLQEDDAPHRFAQEAFCGLATILIALTLLAQLAMPWLIWAMIPGVSRAGGQAQIDLTIAFGRIAFPYILFITLAALLSSMLHSLGRFAVAAAAPVLANILLIAAMVGAHLLGGNVALALIWTVPLAGVAQLGLVALAVTRAGFPLRLRRPRLTPDLRRLVRISAPSILAGSVRHVNVIAGQLVASFFDRAIGWLAAANTLNGLPVGLIIGALSAILLPDLSRKLKKNDTMRAQATFSRATELGMALTLPCVMAFLVIPLPLVSVLFERGAFDSADSAAVALAVAIGALSLPLFVLNRLRVSLFFARGDTRRPFHYALIAVSVNLVKAVCLAPLIGWIAPAIANALSGWVMAWLLYRGSRSMGDAARLDKRFYRRIWRIILASLLMGAELWAAQLWLAEGLITPGWRYLWLAVLILSGFFTYFGSGLALKAFTIEDFRRSLTKQGKSEAAL